MVTPKDYILPAIKKTSKIIWGVLSKVIANAIIISVCIAIVYYLQWFSPIVFGIIAFCGYIWYEADRNYKAEKQDAEDKAKERLKWMLNLPSYWSWRVGEEEKNKFSYEQATKDFKQIMDNYEQKYGKNDFYEEIHNEWIMADRYLQNSLENKSF